MHARALLSAARVVSTSRAVARSTGRQSGRVVGGAGGGRTAASAPPLPPPPTAPTRIPRPVAAAAAQPSSSSPTAGPAAPRTRAGVIHAAADVGDRAPAAVAVAVPDPSTSSSKDEEGPPAPSTALSGAWAAYNAALARHPVLVKSATSFIGFLIGDLIAQAIVGNPYDGHRTLRLVLFGMLMDGPIGEGRREGREVLPAAGCSGALLERKREEK